MSHKYDVDQQWMPIVKMISKLFDDWKYPTKITFVNIKDTEIDGRMWYYRLNNLAEITMFIPELYNINSCITILLHELGHIKILFDLNIDKKKPYRNKPYEYLAWVVARQLAIQYELPYDSSLQYKFLNTYQYCNIPWHEIDVLTDSIHNKKRKRKLRKFAKRYCRRKERHKPIVIDELNEM